MKSHTDTVVSMRDEIRQLREELEVPAGAARSAHGKLLPNPSIR
jgi:hypothetical protein